MSCAYIVEHCIHAHVPVFAFHITSSRLMYGIFLFVDLQSESNVGKVDHATKTENYNTQTIKDYKCITLTLNSIKNTVWCSENVKHYNFNVLDMTVHDKNCTLSMQ